MEHLGHVSSSAAAHPHSSKREYASSGPKRCRECNTTVTPIWRSAPDGTKSLCNACGIRWKRAKNRGGVTAKKTEMRPKAKVRKLRSPRKDSLLSGSNFLDLDTKAVLGSRLRTSMNTHDDDDDAAEADDNDADFQPFSDDEDGAFSTEELDEDAAVAARTPSSSRRAGSPLTLAVSASPSSLSAASSSASSPRSLASDDLELCGSNIDVAPSDVLEQQEFLSMFACVSPTPLHDELLYEPLLPGEEAFSFDDFPHFLSAPLVPLPPPLPLPALSVESPLDMNARSCKRICSISTPSSTITNDEIVNKPLPDNMEGKLVY